MKKVKKIIQEIGVISLSITIVFILVMGISMVKGWTEPTASAPGGNLGAPINTGSIGQIKDGTMIVNNLGAYVTGLTVNKNLEVNGAVHATGDICTDAGGGKCLSASTAVDTTCTEANKGTVRHKLNKLQYCNGSDWKDIILSISCDWIGWRCESYNCQGYVSGGHSGEYDVPDMFCLSGEVTKVEYRAYYMD